MVLDKYEEQLLWGIFAYTPSEDPINIVGHTPLIFLTYQEVYNYLLSKNGKDDMAKWYNKSFVVVIKPFKVLVQK